MQKLQDKIYVALQHEIQKKHSAEDKLSKVVAQETRPGVQGVSGGRGCARAHEPHTGILESETSNLSMWEENFSFQGL